MHMYLLKGMETMQQKTGDDYLQCDGVWWEFSSLCLSLVLDCIFTMSMGPKQKKTKKKTTTNYNEMN